MGNICNTSNLCNHSSVNIHTITSFHNNNLTLPIEAPGLQNIPNFQLTNAQLNNIPPQNGNDMHLDSLPSPDKQCSMKFIDSYNPQNNFFYYLKHILRLQRCYKRHYNKMKAKLKVNELHNNNNNSDNKDIGEYDDIEDEPSLIRNIHITKFSFISRTQSLTSNAISNNTLIKGNFIFKKKNHHYQYIGYANFNRDNSNKQKQGCGKITWDDNSYLMGIFDKNIINGVATFYDSVSGGIFTGEYKNDFPDGYGIYKREGYAQEGYWKANLLNDVGIEYSEDDTYYQGDINNCIKEGIGLFRWSDGTVYKGEFKDNSMNGYGIILYPNGRMYLGEVVNGLMHGYGEFYWGDSGRRYFGFYEEDKRNGFGCYIWDMEPFHAFIGFWERGKMNGVGIKIKGQMFKYGLWKDGAKAIWLRGMWEMLKYSKHEQIPCIKFLMQIQKKLLAYIKRNIQ